MKTISSQRHIDDEIVEAKRAAGDYEVFVSPAFSYDGAELRVVLDGHHSLEAARIDGVAPTFIERDQTEDDRVGLIASGEIEDFLAVTHVDSDWYDIETGHDIW